MPEGMAGGFFGVKIVIDHLGKPDLHVADPWAEFRKMFRLKRFPQVWVSASEPYELSLTKQYPYRDTYPFIKAVYEEFGGRQLIWGTGYPRPRWELLNGHDVSLPESGHPCWWFHRTEPRRPHGVVVEEVWREGQGRLEIGNALEAFEQQRRAFGGS